MRTRHRVAPATIVVPKRLAVNSQSGGRSACQENKHAPCQPDWAVVAA
jgi:hypothetical protein